MIFFYTRQIDLLRRGHGGQAVVLLVTTLGTILLLVFFAVRIGHLGTAKVAATDSIDAISLSAATWEARCLNMNACLNDGILQCLNAIRYVCLVWAALAVAACFGAGMPAFTSYSQRAPGMIRSYWDCAKQLESWAETVRKTAPFLVLAETVDLAKKLDVTGTLIPGNPNGRHDGENTLELHLQKSRPIHLSDVLSPIYGIKDRLRKSTHRKMISGNILQTIDSAMRSIKADGSASVHLLEPEEDFSKCQKIRYAGFKTVSSPYIPLIGISAKDRIFSEASSEPYGGGLADMSWKSRWFDASKKP